VPTQKPRRRPAPAHLGCTPDDVAVRDARDSDCRAIATLLGEPGYPAEPEAAGRRLAGIRKAGGSRVLVATVGRRVVGIVGLHVMPLLHRDHKLCRVLALCVSADFTRQGVGTRLMGAAESFARRAGCHRIELTTAPERTGVHTFYRRLGYTEASLRFAKTVTRGLLPCHQRRPSP
jgi:ribosomal protein S18 acetylase RimI-like enzyme